ncbi:MAG: site-2 protease family protein [Ruminococcaceae bacterium]|nr:site-2 protease family protein [Oscillospiraceae bacterium]
MTAVWTALAAVLVFCLLIFVHEFGHFISAKLLGIRVHEFAIGMGPKLFSRQKGETLYSVRLLPLGGFCALEGEDQVSADERALSNKPAWVKLIVMAAGSCMNLVLGLLLLFCLFGTAKGIVVPEVARVEEAGAAQLAGIVPGDEILRLDGRSIHIVSDLQWARSKLDGGATEVVIRRDGEKKTLMVTPLLQNGVPTLGIDLKTEANSFFLTVKSGVYGTAFYARVVLESLMDLLRGRIPISSMSGPVGIVSEIGNAVQQTATQGHAGFLRLLQLTILLTINLGVFNLLPIPALDGGRILFVLVEMIRRKPLPPEKEGLVHMVGFALLILLSLFVAYMDVLKLI